MRVLGECAITFYTKSKLHVEDELFFDNKNVAKHSPSTVCVIFEMYVYRRRKKKNTHSAHITHPLTPLTRSVIRCIKKKPVSPHSIDTIYWLKLMVCYRYNVKWPSTPDYRTRE